MSISNVNLKREHGLVITNSRSPLPQRSSGDSKDIKNFLFLVKNALDSHQERLGLVNTKRIVVLQAWPERSPNNLDEAFNAVIYKLISRKPMNMAAEGERRQIEPLLREVRNYPDSTLSNLGYVISVYSRSFDNIIEFNVCSTDASDADEWAEFFEDFMVAWRFYFTDMGFERLIYLERLMDKVETIGASTLYIRPIRFMLRTQRIIHVLNRKVNSINISYDTGNAMNAHVIDPETETIEFSVDDPRQYYSKLINNHQGE